jgi:glycosyltransferase involved in cell wall biosynthesis
MIRRTLAAELTVSASAAKHCSGPVHVVLSGVPDSPAIDPAGSVVLVAQRLEREKATTEALDAWSLSGLGFQGWELWIAGDGEEREALERRVARDQLGGVRFLGHVADLSQLRRSSAVFLATSPVDSFGLAVAEAMAAGLPVVASAGGGHFETIGRATPEFLYPPGAADDCARLLNVLAHDAELRRRTGARAQSFQRSHLNLSTHVDRIMSIYRDVLSSEPRADSLSDA